LAERRREPGFLCLLEPAGERLEALVELLHLLVRHALEDIIPRRARELERDAGHVAAEAGIPGLHEALVHRPNHAERRVEVIVFGRRPPGPEPFVRGNREREPGRRGAAFVREMHVLPALQVADHPAKLPGILAGEMALDELDEAQAIILLP